MYLVFDTTRVENSVLKNPYVKIATKNAVSNSKACLSSINRIRCFSSMKKKHEIAMTNFFVPKLIH